METGCYHSTFIYCDKQNLNWGTTLIEDEQNYCLEHINPPKRNLHMIVKLVVIVTSYHTYHVKFQTSLNSTYMQTIGYLLMLPKQVINLKNDVMSTNLLPTQSLPTFS